MRSKHYPIEKVQALADVIREAPVLEPKTVTTEEVLKRYANEIRDLHKNKNYSPSDIVSLLKKSGVMVAVKDVKSILGTTPIPARKQTQKR